MTTRPLLTACGMVLAVCLQAQEKPLLTLEYCQQQAVVNYPSFRQHELLQNSTELKTSNLGKNWLPLLNLNGQVSYQSDVTKVPTTEIFPGFEPYEPLSKDWYKLYLDVSQVVWDGGTTRQAKALESVDHQINIQNLEIELYKLKEQVNNLFFSILLLQENGNLLKIHQGNISARLKEVESAVKNGVVLQSNADILRAELLKVDQKLDELEISMAAAIHSLSILIGEEIPEGTTLVTPEPVVDLSATGRQRLEFGMFALQENMTYSLKKMSGTSLMPKFQAFGQAGIGRPGFDMLKNSFEDYYIVGIRMNWNFWNWNKTRNEKDILEINRQIISTQRETFDKNLSIDMQNKRSEIGKYEKIIQKDHEILELRTNVVTAYASRLENGVITATEYLSELNAESEARLNITIHKIQLIQAKYKYLAAIGQL